MEAMYWNALRTGDRVVVHDDLDPGSALHDGVVGLIQTCQREANVVGIRLDAPDDRMLQPRRQAVHLLPLDTPPACWRCDEIAARATSGAGDRVAT